MWRYITLAAIVIVVVVVGFSLADLNTSDEVEASAILAAADIDLSGFERATSTEYDWQFPRDHGPHPDFLTEWWYYTGNLADADGRRFGYQFTVFRRAILPEEQENDSEWRTRQVYLAHFTVSDIESNAFYHDIRFGRGSAGLAGAQSDPTYRVWIEDWEVQALNDEATRLQMAAANDDISIDFTLEHGKSPVLQGTNGLSPKSDEPGNASYYYTIPRLLTEGTLTIQGESYSVSGNTWMDQEFSTSALGEGAEGWDWFGLIFDDNREMMIGQIRQIDGGKDPMFGGLFVYEDNSTVYLPSDSFTITHTDTWTSPHTGATYPSGWEIEVSADVLGYDEPLQLTLTPLMRDQEVLGTPSYWEGAVEISGDTNGYGYAELTGYVDVMDGFF